MRSVIAKMKYKLMKKYRTFASFDEFLPKLTDLIGPSHILEFGPGISTKVFLNYSNATIYSVETDLTWYEKYKKKIKTKRFLIYYQNENSIPSEIQDFKYDIIFVDGGDRVQALKIASTLLKKQGVVVLHDAHREDYFDGIIKYECGYLIENHSLVLSNNSSVLNQIKQKLVADHSCRCKFCSSESRIEYRKKLVLHFGQ